MRAIIRPQAYLRSRPTLALCAIRSGLCTSASFLPLSIATATLLTYSDDDLLTQTLMFGPKAFQAAAPIGDDDPALSPAPIDSPVDSYTLDNSLEAAQLFCDAHQTELLDSIGKRLRLSPAEVRGILAEFWDEMLRIRADLRNTVAPPPLPPPASH